MKIICVGRNYVEHANELNNAVPSSPLIFMKPQTALVQGGKPFFHPEFSKDIHFEGELVLKICKNGKHIEEKFASKYYDQITYGLDFTARDLQDELKKKGHPWELAKGFDGSAVLGDFVSISNFDTQNIDFQTVINGEVRQNGASKDMIFKFDYLVSFVSKFFTLQQGDLIFTGTPAGVGTIHIGDKIVGSIGGKVLLNCEVK